MPRRATGSIVKRGQRYYVRLTRPDGSRTTRGSWTTRKEAEKQVPGLMAEVHETAAARFDVGPWSFVESEYRSHLATTCSASTLRVRLGNLRLFSRWWAARTKVPTMRQVDAAVVDTYCAERAETVMLSTLKGEINGLRAMWDVAMVRGYASENPWRGKKLRREQEKAIPWISPRDLRRLIARTPVRHRALVQLLAETGLRRGEGYALEWGDVDFDHETILVRRTKSRRIREVELMPQTVKLLEQLERARGPRPTDGSPELVFDQLPSYDLLRQELALACAKARLPRLTPHGLRHVYASHLVRAGVWIPTVADLLGHQDGGALVLRRYGRWAPRNAKRLAVRRLSRYRGKKRTATPKADATATRPARSA